MTTALFDLPVTTKPRHGAEAPDAASDDWYTPMKLFIPLHQELGFTVDAAGAADAPVSQHVGYWHGITNDGLRQDFTGHSVWCNPPYSDIRPWVAKAVDAVTRGAELWAMLLPCWTDRAWWHEFIEPHRSANTGIDVELRFVAGRVRFGYPGNPHGLGNQGGGFDPSVIIIFRRRP